MYDRANWKHSEGPAPPPTTRRGARERFAGRGGGAQRNLAYRQTRRRAAPCSDAALGLSQHNRTSQAELLTCRGAPPKKRQVANVDARSPPAKRTRADPPSPAPNKGGTRADPPPPAPNKGGARILTPAPNKGARTSKPAASNKKTLHQSRSMAALPLHAAPTGRPPTHIAVTASTSPKRRIPPARANMAFGWCECARVGEECFHGSTSFQFLSGRAARPGKP